jgi:hypothetical protein
MKTLHLVPRASASQPAVLVASRAHHQFPSSFELLKTLKMAMKGLVRDLSLLALVPTRASLLQHHPHRKVKMDRIAAQSNT